MIAMYGEHRQAHLKAIIREVCLPTHPHATFPDVNPKSLSMLPVFCCRYHRLQGMCKRMLT